MARPVTELIMKQIKKIVTGAALMLAGIAVSNATTVLREYAFNIDGTITDTFNPPGGLTPTAGVTYGTLDPNTGLGTLTISVAGAGSHYLRVFFDHDVGSLVDDELGSANGSLGAGQTFEIDEPGYGNKGYFGDIWGHFSGTPGSGLDNGVYGGGSDDTSMALGWSFTGDADLLITVGLTAPGSGFYLRQYDDGVTSNDQVFLSGVLTPKGLPPGGVPEGGATLPSLICALVGLSAFKFRVRR